MAWREEALPPERFPHRDCLQRRNFPPSPNNITVTATETKDSSKSSASAVTLLNPVPQLSTVAPMAIPVGAFTLNITGAHFAQGATVNFGTAVLTTTYISSTQLTAQRNGDFSTSRKHCGHRGQS